MQSKATSVKQYLEELPKDRRQAIETVRTAVRKHLDKDYQEGMQYGMICWSVPHKIFPAGYHCDPKQPLPFCALGNQKNYISLYITTNYGEGEDEQWFRQEWAKTGKKLDMGKCCIRFKKPEDLALDVIGEAIRRMPVRTFIARYEAIMKQVAERKGKGKPPTKKTVERAKPKMAAKKSPRKRVKA